MSKCNQTRRVPVIVTKQRKTCDANTEEPTSGTVFFEPGYKFFGQFTYKPSITFDILIVVTIGVEMYLYIKYGLILQDPAASEMLNFNILNIFFCVVGRFAWGFAQSRTVPFNMFELRKSKPHSEDRISGLDLLLAGIFFIVIVATQALRFVKLNVSALDQFLFYVFAAPAEESFFRYFLVSAIISMSSLIIENMMKRKVKRWEEILVKMAVGAIVGIVFGLAHSSRYSQADLLVVILNGIEFSVAYALIRRIDFVLLAHIMLNARAGWEVFV